MSYETELAETSFKDNVIIRINSGAYYGKHQPDSGLSVPAAQRIVKRLAVNPQVIDLLEAKTSFGSVSFDLIDLHSIVTALFNNNLNIFMKQRVEIWLGRMTGSFAWASYHKISDHFITKVGFKKEIFSFTAAEITSKFDKPVFQTKCFLNANTAAGAATLVASTDISSFPSSGRLFIGDEFKNYTSKVDGTKTFTLSGTTANAHSAGDDIFNVQTITDINPITIFLRILQSTGGGTNDVYTEGLGIADADLDLTDMVAIRDEFFNGELFTFEIFDIENILDWIEDNLLKVCSLRIIVNENSKLSLTVLDTSVFGAATKLLDETNILPESVSFDVDDSKVKNVVEMHYGYSYETGEFSRINRVTDTESITNYGQKEPYIVEAKGVPATAAGDTIAADRTERWLARFANATPNISLNAFFGNALTLIGERILLTYDLPTEVGNRVFSKELEVIKKGMDIEKGLINFNLAFTNYSGLRECFISPSEIVSGYTGMFTHFVAGDVTSRWKVGWGYKIYDLAGAAVGTYELDSITYSAGPDRTSFVYSGAVGIPADPTGFRLKFPNQDDTFTTKGGDALTAEQRRYGFISDDAANFPDGTRPYQITF